MDWKNKNVFITGATGFIGGWLAKELVDRQANVTVIVRDLDNQSRNPLYLHKIADKVNVVQGDIKDYELILRILNEREIDYVFHLAAQAIVGVASTSPLSTFESNIKGTWVILEAARVYGKIKGIVVASSDKAYGTHKELPYHEEQALLGLFPYDASKACTDILTRSYHKSYGLPVAVTRNANIYGGADMNFSRIIPEAARCLVQGDVLQIRSDGSPERDFMYVKDGVSAYLTLAENLDRKEVQGQAFNFGTEQPISILSLIQAVIKVAGKSVEPKILGTARNEIDRQYLSVRKAHEMLNWKPKYTLEQGLKETIEWYAEFFKSS